MVLTTIRCPDCNSQERREHMKYAVQSGDEKRSLYQCNMCRSYYSETKDTPLAGLHTPLSQISKVLDALNEGLGINATARVFKVSKNSIYLWMRRLSGLKETLMLYALCHQFITLQIEGDEVYTRVGKNKPPSESEGWTIILMDRASRFIWEMSCDEKTASLFEQAISTLIQVIRQTDELTLITDGERRYGNLLFAICQETIRTGKRGRPKKTFPAGVTARIKNKGNQSRQSGRKRPKYQAPWAEHPDSTILVSDDEIHANHLEAFNSALRRRLSCFRRRTNTYAKLQPALQMRLDVHWIWHNFINFHFTTKLVPAVAIGILDQGFSWSQIFRLQAFKLY